MRVFITMSGRARKTNKSGIDYGWNSMVLPQLKISEKRAISCPSLTRTKAISVFVKGGKEALEFYRKAFDAEILCT